MNQFYESLAPGGLLVATNVDISNPIRNMLEYLLAWHLIYRDQHQIQSICPDDAALGNIQINHDSTKVNVFVEVRKPLQ